MRTKDDVFHIKDKYILICLRIVMSNMLPYMLLRSEFRDVMSATIFA
jgi:hypothetical protein